MRGSTWPREAVRIATDLRDQGLSYQGISNGLLKSGFSYTRYAVQSKLCGMGLPSLVQVGARGAYTREATEYAVSLFHKGMKHSEIADLVSARFGVKTSRAGTATHLHRLGYKRCGQELKRLMSAGASAMNAIRNKNRKPPPPKPINPKPHAPRVKLAHDRLWRPLDGVEPVAFLDRQRHQCSWPIDGDGYRCCGSDVESGRVYCSTHARIAYQSMKPRKRA